jgi:hypothetical protein
MSKEAKDAIMGAAYEFRDAHISGSMNLKRSAHAALESAVDAALKATPPAAQQDQAREISFDRAELWLKRINEAVLAEREAVEDLLKEYDMATSAFAKDFRARGQA